MQARGAAPRRGRARKASDGSDERAASPRGGSPAPASPPRSPANGGGNQRSLAHPAAAPALLLAEQPMSARMRSLKTRTRSTLIMVAGFTAVLYAGHVVVCAFIVCIQARTALPRSGWLAARLLPRPARARAPAARAAARAVLSVPRWRPGTLRSAPRGLRRRPPPARRRWYTSSSCLPRRRTSRRGCQASACSSGIFSRAPRFSCTAACSRATSWWSYRSTPGCHLY